ncbi:MAG: hypothetical protein M1815_004524 [Lichina confinis]|nr:MAG: hypothetical protein M1815_004524 [Lichina confinis]
MIDRIARFWRRSYAPDYVGIVIILIGYLLVRVFSTWVNWAFSQLIRSAIRGPTAKRYPPGSM